MLRKLLKHEFRATGRMALPLCVGMVGLSVLAAIAMTLVNREGVGGALHSVSAAVLVLYVLGFFALTIGMIVMTIVRFYQSLLHNEGYLTMTLPCSLGKILSAKLICALVWYLAAFVIVCAAVAILFSGQIDWGVLFRGSADFFRSVFQEMQSVSAEDIFWFVSLLLEGIVLAALAALQTTLHFYAAMAIGHSFSKSKALFSVIAFFVLSWLYSALTFGGLFSAGSAPFDLFSFHDRWSVHAALGLCCGVCLLTDAVLYAITHLCLRYQLNLE